MRGERMTIPEGRRKAKRAPMGTTPEQFLDDLKRVYAQQGKISIDVYRWHGSYSTAAIDRKFGSWNRGLTLAGLPVNYNTAHLKDLLGADRVKSKLTTYPCWKCQKPFKGLGRRKGNWHCERCTASINIQAANMAWLG